MPPTVPPATAPAFVLLLELVAAAGAELIAAGEVAAGVDSEELVTVGKSMWGTVLIESNPAV